MDDTTRTYFEKQLSFSLNHQRYRDCPYFPCHHMTEQNCLFCYCPFYPCGDETKGTWLQTPHGNIWDCSPCTWIHTDEVVATIIRLLYENKSFPEIHDILWQKT